MSGALTAVAVRSQCRGTTPLWLGLLLGCVFLSQGLWAQAQTQVPAQPQGRLKVAAGAPYYSKENEVISKAAEVTYFNTWQQAGPDWYKVWIKAGDKAKVGYVSKQNAVVEGAAAPAPAAETAAATNSAPAEGVARLYPALHGVDQAQEMQKAREIQERIDKQHAADEAKRKKDARETQKRIDRATEELRNSPAFKERQKLNQQAQQLYKR